MADREVSVVEERTFRHPSYRVQATRGDTPQDASLEVYITHREDFHGLTLFEAEEFVDHVTELVRWMNTTV